MAEYTKEEVRTYFNKVTENKASSNLFAKQTNAQRTLFLLGGRDDEMIDFIVELLNGIENKERDLVSYFDVMRDVANLGEKIRNGKWK